MQKKLKCRNRRHNLHSVLACMKSLKLKLGKSVRTYIYIYIYIYIYKYI